MACNTLDKLRPLRPDPARLPEIRHIKILKDRGPAASRGEPGGPVIFLDTDTLATEFLTAGLQRDDIAVAHDTWRCADSPPGATVTMPHPTCRTRSPSLCC